jgi:hypothetical protein
MGKKLPIKMMNGIYALFLLGLALMYTSNRRMQKKNINQDSIIKNLNERLSISNQKVNDLEEKIAKLIQRYE